jgi:Bacterial Ig-like domain
VRPAVVIGALVALLAASSGVRASGATFTAHDEFTATISTAADWVAPAVTLTTPADDSYSKTTSVTVSGAAGNATGDSTTVTLEVYSGSAATGTPVVTRAVTRSAATWSTSVTTLGQGTYTAQATQTDSAGNTATSTAHTFTIDSIAPTRVSIAAANGGAGTSGHLDSGDTITFTYSEPMLASSILSGWSGASAASVKVRFFSGTTDAFTVLDSASAANVKLDAGTTAGGGVSLGSGANFVTSTVTFGATLTQSADDKSFVITLGSPDIASRVVSTRTGTANMTWTPKAGSADLAGNALASTATWTETDGDRDF